MIKNNNTHHQLHLTILGAGPAGLSTGYYAKAAGIPFTIFESEARIGGNCITHRRGDFLFDSGAHRLHDRDPEITADYLDILENDVHEVSRTSYIFDNGKLIMFPLNPFDLLIKLNKRKLFKFFLDIIRSRIALGNGSSFRDFAIKKYGSSLASSFLLNYSEKLWGLSADKLSPMIAGKRLNGLGLSNAILNLFTSSLKSKRHMEGKFYYPATGIGLLSDRLGVICGTDNIRLSSRITKMHHDNNRIFSIEINDEKRIPVNHIVSSLPVTLFLDALSPSPDNLLIDIQHKLRYRNLVLVALFINKPSITDGATLYFPGKDINFTRVYEPRNRCHLMSPEGNTSLVAEIPCSEDDEIWISDKKSITRSAIENLTDAGLITPADVIGSAVERLRYAYPILEKDYFIYMEKAEQYLSRFSNLTYIGRNGRFTYSWIHDQMRSAKDAIKLIKEET
ncbi:MAG: FAD-dependent oxidoreductase [Nitrospirota bacterium]|nr:MAG: FAD-dependent oxidoreductase [Nitrospirota bacterium]